MMAMMALSLVLGVAGLKPVISMLNVPPVLLLEITIVLGLWWKVELRASWALQAEVDRLRVERELRAEQACLDERARIAREMHDVLAHRLSLLVLHTGVLEIRGAHPQLPDRLVLIRRTAAQALAELRELLGVLHQSAPSAGDNPTAVPKIAEIVQDSRTAGVDVTLSLSGHEDQLPTATRLAVVRVVQEALTNVRKHAAGAPAHVEVQHAGDESTVCVRNDPPPDRSTHRVDHRAFPVPGSGLGLVGLRERVRALGGWLSAEPTPGGGYEVSVVIPVRQSSGEALR